MWSAGCIFTEMLTGKPIFPGDHDLEQMLLILEVIPVQEADLVEVEDSIPRKMLKNYKGSPRIALADVLPDIDPDGEFLCFKYIILFIKGQCFPQTFLGGLTSSD